jgi:hypothetical protein
MNKTIKEFISVMECCPFCDTPLSCELSSGLSLPKLVTTDNVSQILFPTTIFDDGCKFFYSSKIIDEKLGFYYYTIGSVDDTHLIFSIDINDNILYGVVDYAQQVLLTKHLFILRKCNNYECYKSGYSFMYQSSPLVLGRKTKKIYPFNIAAEAITVIIDKSKFSIMSSYDLPSSFLLDRKGIIATLPKLSLLKVNNNLFDKDALIKKIKTYVLFS